MPFSRALLLKGLGGVAAVGAVGVGGYGVMYPNDFSDLFKSQKTINEENKKKADGVNEKLKTLGLAENGCKLEISDFPNTSKYSKVCELNKDKFKKIKFSNSGTTDVEVQGWTEKKNIKLTISNKPNGEIKFLFGGHPSNLTITKTAQEQTDKVSIRTGKETEFEFKDGKLSKIVDQAFKSKLEKVNQKISPLSLPSGCSFDVTEKDMVLECGLDDSALKAIKFSNKKDSEQEQLKVTGTVGSNLKLKVELGDNNEPSFSFTGLSEDLTILGDSTKGKIVIRKEGDRKFKEEKGKLEKVTKNDEAKIKKLQEINKQLSDLKIPDKCLLDEREEDASGECELSLDEFKAIKLTSKENETLTVAADTGFSKAKLKVELKKNEHTEEDETIYTLSGLDKKIKFGKSGEEIVLDKDKSYGFEVREGKLGPKRLLKTGGDIFISWLKCTYTNNSSNKGTCETNTYFVDLLFAGENGQDEVQSVNWNDNQETFDFLEYQEGFEEGVKFTYKGTTHEASGRKDRKLEQNKEYELKESIDKRWCLKEKAK